MREKQHAPKPQHHEAYWLAYSHERYTLMIDGELRAMADLVGGGATILRDGEYNYHPLPASVNAIEFAEKTLGLAPVTELRRPDGGREPDHWRAFLTDQAEAQRRRFSSPEQEARMYAREAELCLHAWEQRGLQTEKTKKARHHVGRALAALGREDRGGRAEALRHLREAVKNFPPLTPPAPRNTDEIAHEHCSCAIHCLENAEPARKRRELRDFVRPERERVDHDRDDGRER